MQGLLATSVACSQPATMHKPPPVSTLQSAAASPNQQPQELNNLAASKGSCLAHTAAARSGQGTVARRETGELPSLASPAAARQAEGVRGECHAKACLKAGCHKCAATSEGGQLTSMGRCRSSCMPGSARSASSTLRTPRTRSCSRLAGSCGAHNDDFRPTYMSRQSDLI